MACWYFVRVGHPKGQRSGHYGIEYEMHVRHSVMRAGGVAHFIRDGSMPVQLREMGWWAKLWFFSPYAERAAGEGSRLFFADLDTVFIDTHRLEDALSRCKADIVGIKSYGDGLWTSGLGMVRVGSPGARRVWAEAMKLGLQFNPGQQEHLWIRSVAGKYLGMLEPDWLVPSYKCLIGQFDEHESRVRGEVKDAAAICFHGDPRPTEVWENPSAPLHSLIREHW